MRSRLTDIHVRCDLITRDEDNLYTNVHVTHTNTLQSLKFVQRCGRKLKSPLMLGPCRRWTVTDVSEQRVLSISRPHLSQKLSLNNYAVLFLITGKALALIYFMAKTFVTGL